MKNIQQGLTMVDRMIMVTFIGVVILEFFVQQPLTELYMTTSFF
jgi:hypothetical protein